MVYIDLLITPSGFRERYFQISSKISPPLGDASKTPSSLHRQGERLLGKRDHCQVLAHSSTCFTVTVCKCGDGPGVMGV